jgi:hypothetical protein
MAVDDCTVCPGNCLILTPLAANLADGIQYVRSPV